jgi:NADH-quinone oxidoreductase subunit J
MIAPATPVAAGADGGALTALVDEYGAIGSIGVPMFLDYVVPLQVTGVLLLVAVIGAVVLAKRSF